MTRSEQFRKSRAWLKTRTFAVTNSLRNKLESIPEPDQEGYCYIQNMVLVLSDEYGQKFASIPSSLWKQRLGSDYKRFLNQLKKWNELEIDPNFRWSKDKSGYPMSYAVPVDVLDQGTCLVDFTKKRIRLPRPKNKPTDAVSEYALKCLAQLEVGKTLIYPPVKNPVKNTNIRKVQIKMQCEHIASGDFSLSYGRKVKRLFHR